MSEQPIQVYLPEDVYHRMQRIADEADRPMEDLVRGSLGLLFGGAFTWDDVDSLSAFTDQQLWAVVHQRLSEAHDARWHELAEKNRDGVLTDIETDELNRLVQEINHQMLLRSEALVLLKQRGYDIDAYRNQKFRFDDVHP